MPSPTCCYCGRIIPLGRTPLLASTYEVRCATAYRTHLNQPIRADAKHICGTHRRQPPTLPIANQVSINISYERIIKQSNEGLACALLHRDIRDVDAAMTTLDHLLLFKFESGTGCTASSSTRRHHQRASTTLRIAYQTNTIRATTRCRCHSTVLTSITTQPTRTCCDHHTLC